MTITANTRSIIRTAAVDRGCKYRITAEGEVHFYGTMPNSTTIGWWLFAQSVDEALRQIGR